MTSSALRISAEMQTILDLTRPQSPDETLGSIADRLTIGDLNANDLIMLARRHRVISTVARRLLDAEVTGALAATMARRLARQITLSRTLTETTGNLVDLLQHAGVRAIVLKGPAVACRLYSRASDRQSKDIDLLIAPDDIAPAVAALQSDGYTLDYPIQRATVARLDALRSMSCDLVLRKDQADILLELHWRTDRNRSYLDWSLASLPDPVGQSDLAGRSAPILSLPNQIVYLIAHGAKHSWYRLYWLADIAHAVTLLSEQEWAQIADQAEASGHSRNLATALQLVWQAYQLSPPAAVQHRIARHHCPQLTAYCWRSLLGQDARTHIRLRNLPFLAQSFGYRMAQKPGWRYKTSVLLQTFVEPRDIAWFGLSSRWTLVYALMAPVTACFRMLSRG